MDNYLFAKRKKKASGISDLTEALYGPTVWISSSGGTGETPSQLLHHF
jgi:hypothetical protein